MVPMPAADLRHAYRQHRAMLLRLLTARTGSSWEADDLLQEMWMKLQPQPGSRIADPKAYLCRMAQNLANDRLRAHQRRATRDRRWSDEMTDFAPHGDAVDAARTAEGELIAREEVATVAAAIADLPEAARRTLELHKLEGLSHAETAARLGISRSGVEKNMALAMRRLRHALLG